MGKYVKLFLLLLCFNISNGAKAESFVALCGDMWIRFEGTSDTTLCAFEVAWPQDLVPDMNLILPDTVYAGDGRVFTVTSFDFPNGGVYYGYENIGKIVFPKSIRGGADISKFINLKTIIVDDADIGLKAFDSHLENPGCGNLEYVDLGNKATGAFLNCKKLRTVKISRSCTRLDNAAFTGCESLEEVIWTGTREEGAKPMVIEGYSDSDYGAFKGCKSLKEIELPDCEIGEMAFMDCPALEKVTMENQSSITALGNYAFSGCTSLKDIDLSNWNAFGDYSFKDCSSLTSLTLPPRIESLGRGVFSGCEKLRLKLPADYSFASDTSDDRLWVDGNDIFYTIRVKNIDSGKEVLAEGATMQFCPSGVGTLDLTQPVIDVNAPGLMSTKVPMTKINGALRNVAGLEKLSIRADLIDAPEILSHSSSLRELIVTEGVRSRFEETQPGQWELRTENVPVEYLSSMAFADCGKLEKVTLPEGYVRLGNSVFSECRSLTDISLPSTVRRINDGTFANCTSLRNVHLPEQLEMIGSNTFRNCGALGKIDIPPTVSSIGESAFWNCSALTTVSLPDGLKAIKEYAFKGCTSLTEIDIPGNVNQLDHHAFEGCESAGRVVIGDGVAEIGDFAFYDCSGAEYLEIGAGVEYVGFGAYLGMDSLKTIVCNGETPPDYPTGFSQEVIENAGLTVPEGCEDAYRSNVTWDPFIDGDSGLDDITTDGSRSVILTADRIEAPEGMEVWIYGIDGRLAAHGYGSFSHALPAGLYIVRTPGSVNKQVIR